MDRQAAMFPWSGRPRTSAVRATRRSIVRIPLLVFGTLFEIRRLTVRASFAGDLSVGMLREMNRR